MLIRCWSCVVCSSVVCCWRFFFKQKTAYEMRISDWSSDVCSSDLLDLDDNSLAENTRGAYPIDFIPNSSEKNLGPVPKNIIMLTADAFGVLPPIARLTPEQAMYHFLSGHTAKVAGTEIGVTEPERSEEHRVGKAG